MKLPTKLLIANRGEIAIRIARAAAELGIQTVAIYSTDDSSSLHLRKADEAFSLAEEGVAAYLNIENILTIARRSGANAIHPGYGFLSEQADFAAACRDAGIAFIGPSPEILAVLGDKSRARIAAELAGIPILKGTVGDTSLAKVREFYESLTGDNKAIVIKAIAGGGGRGMRVVDDPEQIEQAYTRCRSEAQAAFGNGTVYAEQLLPKALHIEVQILGDRQGHVVQIGERDCSIQRRHQKLIEIAPSPALAPQLRKSILQSAETLARAINYHGIGTFEFLVSTDGSLPGDYAFIEANPRLQVEHTITEAITGIDLVATQIQLAAGMSLDELDITGHTDRGSASAIQLRVNMETMTADGSVLPSGGELSAFEPPSGPGIRVDTFGYTGYHTNPRFDSLLAKVIVQRNKGDFRDLLAQAYRALGEFRIDGVNTNIGFLQSLLQHGDVQSSQYYTRFIDHHVSDLIAGQNNHRRLYYHGQAAAQRQFAGARVDHSDPLAVLNYGQSGQAGAATAGTRQTGSIDGHVAVNAPLQGTIVSILVTVDSEVRAGETILIIDSMKMEHEVKATSSGFIRQIAVTVGDTIYDGHALLYIEDADLGAATIDAEEAIDLNDIRPDLAETLQRRHLTRDEARPDAVARRRKTNQRTARENIQHLCDADTFVEYGPLVLAAQRRRRTVEELIEKSPADGMITGVGSINGDLFADPDNRCVVMSYDYTVFAGTQGGQNHRKTDRMIDVAGNGQMPMVLFAEGGGGRPGDTDMVGGGNRTFARFATLSGLVPMVGITSGRCFAGNASLLGCCDVIIATANSNIGMGGPAMIEGGGLGVFSPEEIGGMDIQVPSGVVDIAVADEYEAVNTAKKYLGFFQGSTSDWQAPDQRSMRRIVPENRLRVYNIRSVIETLADDDSLLEIRQGFGIGMVTSFIRVEGRPLGVIANNPMHLGGAIDSDGADKAARFMQLCDAFDIPILFLCDTPGIMVGPEIEKTALVRHSSRMFLIGANLSVPFFTVVIRKSYGLGGIAMAGGSFKTPFFSVAWPTGEFGGMGLEGSVKLGYRNELAAIEDPEQRKATYDQMVARAYENGKALNNASLFGVDDTIDPAETRFWVANLLKSTRVPRRSGGKKRPAIDAW